MSYKKLLLTLILASSLLICGCMGGRELNTLAIAIAMGIDKVDNGYLITYQVLNPKALASQKQVNQAPTVLYQETGKDLFETIRRFTTISPRKLYNSHLRIVVLGEDFAKEGIRDIVDFLYRDHEFRTDFFFVVTRGITANKLLETITPIESVTGMSIYDSIKAAEASWAPVKPVMITELINTLISDGKNLTLTGISPIGTEIPSNSADALLRTDSTKIKLSGTCIFKGDKLIGWLNEDESKGLSYITGDVKDTVGYVELGEKSTITFEVINEKSKITVLTSGNSPSINVEINMKSNVAAETGSIDISSEENIKRLNQLVEEKITVYCNATIKKAKEDLKSDIFGFGEEIHRTYPDYWKEIKKDWSNEYPNLPVSVSVKSEINGLGQNTKSVFSKGMD
ncbi:MAG: Ger(x)C family spore germination protein [Pseudomonadota bacterium]